MFGIRSGIVAEFDAHRGTGTIRAEDGEDYKFHCTELADGKRDIEIGAKVRFELVAGLGGRTEARAIVTEEN